MENKLRKFKLIDKRSFLSRSWNVRYVIENILNKGDIIEGFFDGEGNIVEVLPDGLILIAEDELQFFEEIYSEQTFWEENTPLEKSLIVGKKCQGERAFQIEHVGKEVVLLKEVDSEEESCTTKDNLKSLLPDEDEMLFQKVLSKWKSVSLDNAYDYKDSVVHLSSFYDVVKKVFEEQYKP